MSNGESFAVGYVIGAFVATAGCLLAILHETRRNNARNNLEPGHVRTRRLPRTSDRPVAGASTN